MSFELPFFGLGLLLISLGAASEARASCALPDAPTDYGFMSQQLAPNVFALYQPGFHVQPRGNVEVIEQSRSIVLVDSGGSPAAAEEVIAFIRKTTGKPVTAIVLTHWHGDHVLGVSRLLQEWPAAKVISTVPTRDMLADPRSDHFMPGDNAEANAKLQKDLVENIDFLCVQGARTDTRPEISAGYRTAAKELKRYASEVSPAHRPIPSKVFERELKIPDRLSPVEIRFLGRANTAGDAIVWLPRQRVLITGDTVVEPVPYGFNSYPAEWIEVLERMRQLNFAVLAPGHGKPMRDKSYLDRMISLLKETRRQVIPLAGDQAVTLDNVGAKIKYPDLRALFVHDDPWLRGWFNAYWTLPAASSALREARHQPIVQGAD